MKISELRTLIRQLAAIILTVALLLTAAPTGVRVAKADGAVTVKSVEFVNPTNDTAMYTFYKDFNQYDYIATGSRINVTYAVDGGEDYTEQYYADWTSNASEQGDYNEDAECYETQLYSLLEDSDDYIMVRYDQDTNTVYAHVPTDEEDESGVDFDLYQPIYKELSEMPEVSIEEKKNIESCGYTQYYRLNSEMAGICADINTADLEGVEAEDDPMLELYEKVSGAETWNYSAGGEDKDAVNGDFNDRLVYNIKEGADYILGVSNLAYEDQVYYLNEEPYAEFSITEFVPAIDYQVQVQENYAAYPQLGVYPYRYDLTKEDGSTETVYGTGSYVDMKDGYVRNTGTTSQYTGLDGNTLSTEVEESRIQTVSFTEKTGEEYTVNTAVTVPAKTQKLVYMNYSSTVDYTLNITDGDEDTFISYVNETMAQSNVYGYATSGAVLDNLFYYSGDMCYILLQNYSDHEATYQISDEATTADSEPTVTPNNTGSQTSQVTATAAPQTNQQTTVSTKTSIKGKKATVKKIQYKAISEKTAAVVGTTAAKKLKTVTIPAKVTIKGVSCKVVAINRNAFKNCKKLKTVKLGKNVSQIKRNAFKNCKKLKTVTLTAKKTKMAKNAFKGCKKVTFKVMKAKKKSYKKAIKKAKIGCKYSVK